MSSVKSDDEMQFGSEGDQNSVDSFEKQLQQQEQELQSQLRQQEEEDEAKKVAAAVAAASVSQVPEDTESTVVAAAPAPVAAPEGWQENTTGDVAMEVTPVSNGTVEAETPADLNSSSDAQQQETVTTAVTVGVKRSLETSNDTEENGGGQDLEDAVERAEADEDKQPSPKQRKLDEFSKLWAAVKETPKDFQAWTMLLQHVDQQSELESGRDAYGAFFARYPYCYGYWKKFADLEKRKGTKETTLQVFERGLASIPLSVDLWVHYLDYVTNTFSEPDEEDFVRQQFERAVVACGVEFRSDKMWDAFINWESSNKRWQRVTSVYDRLLASPVAKYLQHWTKFQDHVKRHQSSEVVTAEEFLSLRRSLLAPDDPELADVVLGTAVVDEAPPGVEDDSTDGTAAAGDSAATAVAAAVTAASEEENKNIQQLIIAAREKVHQATSEEVKLRWPYEDAIKRPYFHVKPLERSQLQAWRDYLEFESKQGNELRTKTLFERCLIAAALYEEFWMRYLHYLETLSSVTVEEMRAVYQRACTIHLRDKLKPHLSWATFEEEKGNVSRSLELLSELQERLPETLEPHVQAVAVERRRGNLEHAEELFSASIDTFKSKGKLTITYANLLVKYARFLSLFRNNSEKAVTVLQTVMHEHVSSGVKLSECEQQCLETLLWALVERAMACTPPQFNVAAEALKSGTSTHYPPHTRVLFAHRFNQFIAECGQPGVSVSESTKLLRDLQAELRQLEASQGDGQEGGSVADKSEDNADNNSSSESRREKRTSKGSNHSNSYSSDRQQQHQQQAPPSTHNSGGHQQNGNNMGGGGHGGGYNQNSGGGNNYQQYPPQSAGGAAVPPHQPPQHPPPPQGQQGYGGYNQNYQQQQQQQGYPPQQYQGWGYPQQQGGYGYNQQGWAGYPNYYGQR